MPSRGQSVVLSYRAWNTTTQAYQSGDAGNHNLRLLKDSTEASPTNAATEVDGTNAPGLYYIALTSAETIFNTVTIAGKSSTAGVSLFGQTIAFEQLPVAAAASAGGLLTFGSSAGQLSTNAGGIVDSNVVTWAGQTALTNAGFPVVTTAVSGSIAGTVQANLVSISGQAVSITSAGFLRTDVEQWLGQTVSAHVSGIPDTNTLFWAQAPALLDGNKLPKVDMEDIVGSSISAQLAEQIVTVIAVASGANVATPNLSTYLTDVQNLLGVGGTSTQTLYTTTQLTSYINKARMQIAGEGQCVRVLTPISNGITSITVQSGGQGYTSAPTVVIVAPDSPSGQLPNFAGVQATAVASISAGQVVAVTVLSGGAGYFSPGVTLVGGGGTNAVAVASVASTARTTNGQEVYPFSQFNPLVQVNPGVQNIIQVNSVNTIWGTFRYTLIHKSFSAYQSYARTYTAGYEYIPTVWAQYAQGANGSIYMYPIPNDAYQLELDCFCLPIQLNTSTDPEAIPAQWTDAVPFLAAYYAFLGSQRMADAQLMWKEFEKYMKRARQQAQSHGVINPYGRA